MKLTKCKKHVSITLNLHDFLIVSSAQRNHKLTGAREYARGFSTLVQLQKQSLRGVL